LEQVLEQYSFNRLSEVDTETAEEHLLVCATCQTALQEIDEYILLMKVATADYEAVDLVALAMHSPRRTNNSVQLG
jgi:hypothetical protein